MSGERQPDGPPDEAAGRGCHDGRHGGRAGGAAARRPSAAVSLSWCANEERGLAAPLGGSNSETGYFGLLMKRIRSLSVVSTSVVFLSAAAS